MLSGTEVPRGADVCGHSRLAPRPREKENAQVILCHLLLSEIRTSHKRVSMDINVSTRRGQHACSGSDTNLQIL